MIGVEILEQALLVIHILITPKLVELVEEITTFSGIQIGMPRQYDEYLINYITISGLEKVFFLLGPKPTRLMSDYNLPK